ncbi:MAG: class I SAM-dependent methyltransferase [Rhodobacteraceae bacterium]|nr:class I SAM-dependent methyltransferase [Paracoccaceae bacterium]
MWTGLLDRAMRPLIRVGRVTADLPDGTRIRWGTAGTGPDVQLRIHDTATLRAMALNPDLALGEAYMDGRLTIGNDDLEGLLELAFRNDYGLQTKGLRRAVLGLRRALRWVWQYNPAARSRVNVAHHYDLSGALYDLFLDADRQYSCAYFPKPGMSLDAAQTAKKRHIARKLLIEPGMRVLDIGSGWGGLGLMLARDFGADVTGVTLSTEQHALSNRRARDAGLAGQARFELRDYRDVTETFDRIVSVGMFEHVGVPHYREYFRTIRERLAPGGVALVHTIGRSTPPGSTNAWLTKYIFPGGYCPALSESSAAIEKEGLVIADVEVWRLHYAETLRHWLTRFEANIDAARALYDERFCRMWRFYLLACEMSFRYGAQVVFQFQLALDNDSVPVSRDYLYPAHAPEQARPARKRQPA